jgi:hypothetical protein
MAVSAPTRLPAGATPEGAVAALAGPVDGA